MIESHLAEDPLESNGLNRCRMAQARLLPCYHTRKHAILQLSLSRASAHATIHQRMVRRARRDTRVAHTNMEYAYVHIIFVSTPASPLLLTYGAEIMLGNHAGKPDDRHRVANGTLADDNRGQLLRIAPTTPHLKYLHLTDSDPTLGDLHVLCNSVTPVRGSA